MKLGERYRQLNDKNGACVQNNIRERGSLESNVIGKGESIINIHSGALTKLAAKLVAVTIALVYLIGASTSDLSFWPLTTISIYGSTLPAAYFFRAGMISTGNLIVLLALSLRKYATFKFNHRILLASGFCLIACAAISCKENNAVHTVFALVFFLLLSIFQITVARNLFFRLHPTKEERELRCYSLCAGLFVLSEILFVLLMGAHVFALPKKIVIPILEWSGVLVIIGFLFHLEKYLNAKLNSESAC